MKKHVRVWEQSMQAVIIAGGQGTRLQGINREIPKALFPISEKTIIEYQIENLNRYGISDITLIVGHLGGEIKRFCGNGEKWNVHINYITEEVPLGTGGALYYLKNKVNDDFIMLYGDLILNVDFERFMNFHKNHTADITLFVHPNSHPYDSDLVVADQEGKVERILSKHDDRNSPYHNLVNSGIYCVNPKALKWFREPKKADLDREFIPDIVKSGKVYAYKSTEYVKDMGTPDRLRSVAQDVLHGLAASRNLSSVQRAIFLDRDGTINELNGFVSSPDGFRLLPGVADAIKRINQSDYLTVVITNQPVVARGECTEATLEEIHKKMETELGSKRAYVDALYYCPHHPDKGFEGEIPELKIDCECRKPKIGMIIRAADELHISIKDSWFVGDSTVDVQTGINAGMKTILLHTGECGKDGRYNVKADYEAEDLNATVDLILGKG